MISPFLAAATKIYLSSLETFTLQGVLCLNPKSNSTKFDYTPLNKLGKFTDKLGSICSNIFIWSPLQNSF